MNSSTNRPGLLFTLVAPAGAGKNSLMRHVLALTDLRQLPTATTRAIRPGEQEGREHFYVSMSEFERMIEADELLEYQRIHGNLYGMQRKAVEDAINSGQSLIADIEVLGVARARAAYPNNVVSIFIQAPSIGTLIERMRDRDEREAEIGKRLLRVPMELAYAPQCDYVILNDSFERAAGTLYQIVAAELRGEHSSAGDPLLDYRVHYLARSIPVYHDEVLRCDEPVQYPAIPFTSSEMPHEAALRCLRDVLKVEPRDENLVCGGAQDGQYQPPVMLDYAEKGDDEWITYVYAYQLDQRITPPAGWSWSPLPDDLRVALERCGKRESA